MSLNDLGGKAGFTHGCHYEPLIAHDARKVLPKYSKVVPLSEVLRPTFPRRDTWLFIGCQKTIFLRHRQNCPSFVREYPVNFFDGLAPPGHVLQHVKRNHGIEA